VVSGLIASEYNPEAAKVLRQPALVSYIQSKVNDISPELQKEPLVRTVSERLTEIQKLVAFPGGGTPSAEEVRKVNEAVSNLMTVIQSKPEAK